MRGALPYSILLTWLEWCRPMGLRGIRHKVRGSLVMTGLEGLLLGLVALIVLDLLSLRYGRDSRTSSDTRRDWNA